MKYVLKGITVKINDKELKYVTKLLKIKHVNSNLYLLLILSCDR